MAVYPLERIPRTGREPARSIALVFKAAYLDFLPQLNGQPKPEWIFMHIACPHCENGIELVTGPDQKEVLCSSCGSSFRLAGGTTTNWRPKEGQRFLGKFELLCQVGTGAFGTVYQAHDSELDRIVAIKVPRAGNLDGSDSERFLREARSVAQLRHPAIVSVFEVGQHEGLPFLVSEFISGLTLADRLTGERPPPRESAALVAEVADALHYAHEHGVIHRDVKPSNIMLDQEGKLHVMDFGLAKRDAGEITVTIDGQVLGTPAYMSPEQARGDGHRADSRSDIYGLGVILYQLLTGKLPFKGNSRMLLHQVLNDEPVPPRKRVPALALDLETICLKAMAKEPESRYSSAKAFAEDVRRFLAGEPIKARRTHPAERALRWIRRRPVAAALCGLAGCLLILAIGSGAWWLHSAHRQRLDEKARLLAEEDAKQIKVEYFANITKRFGVPEGIVRLSAEQARRRGLTYRLTRRGSQVEALEIINGHGELKAKPASAYYDELASLRADSLNNEICRHEFKRNEQGRLTQDIAFDRIGEIVWVLHYSSPNVAFFADRKGFPRSRSGSGLSYVEFTWTEDGLEREVHYLDKNGNRRPDERGVFGVRKTYNAQGLVERLTLLNISDKPLSALTYAHVLTRYDSDANLIEASYFDAHDRPALASGRCAAVRYAYDQSGNDLEMTAFDLNNKPTLCRGKVTSFKNQFDEWGDHIASHAYNAKGEMTLDTGGVAGWTARYDARGNRIEQRYQNVDGAPMLCRQGYAILKNRYDDRGLRVEDSYAGTDGKPVRSKDGIARRTITYDARGFPAEHACFGLDGKPCAFSTGWARYKTTYDDRGNLTSAEYFDTADKPALVGSGYAKFAAAYDDRGNLVEKSYFGTDGKLIQTNAGMARYTTKYDDRGYVAERSYYDADGRLTLHNDGCARDTHEYNERGRLIAQAFYGADGKLMIGRFGWAVHRYKYDERYNIIEESCYDTKDAPCLNKYGYHRASFDYDSEGVLASSTYYDLARKAIPTEVFVDYPEYSKTDATGLKADDVLLSYEGQPLACYRGFLYSKYHEPAGDKPKELRILRDGKPEVLKLRPGPIDWDVRLESRVVANAK